MLKNKETGITWIIAIFAGVLLGCVVQTRAEELINVKAMGPGKPVVGVYYYPWYRGPDRGRQWTRVMRQHLKVPQEPAVGLHQSDDHRVIGAHIAQSLHGGIDFWAVSWWGPDQICDDNLRQAILPHPDAHKLKYAILYEATGRLGTFAKPHYRHWMSDLAYLEKTYFGRPDYLRIKGRPVLFVYLTREYFRNRGEKALAQMREKFPHVYLVGDDVFGEGYRSEWAENFDAVTAYDVYGQSVGRFGGTHKALDFLARNYQHAKAEANKVGTAFMPTIAPGYNDTAVRKGHPGRARYFTDVPDSKEGDIFRAMIQQVALPHLDSGCGRVMMVTSFNEWYEDSQIEATAGTAPVSYTDDSESGTYYTGGQRYVDYGYLYLDILRQATQ
ncbi:MAG: hypothetical protein ISS70_24265 [Phycisphaerae bacterium]|nr:hypothetical protein [Phycisphaerae bacterium]